MATLQFTRSTDTTRRGFRKISLTMRSQPADVSSQVSPVHYARSISADDFASDCPVSLDLVASLTCAEPDGLANLLDGIPEVKRARLAVWLYGRSHTHEIGVRVAATCDGATLRRVAGLVGNQLYDLSRRPYISPSHGTHGAGSRRQVSLGGSRSTTAYASL